MYLDEHKLLTMKYLLFLCCFAFFFAHGQEDPLMKKMGDLNKKTWKLRDSTLINEMNQIAADSLFSNTEKALFYSRFAFKASKKIEFKDGQILSIRNLIRCKIYQSDFDSAMVFVNQLLPQLNYPTSTKIKVQAYEAVGNVYDFQGKYDQAIKYYLKAIMAAGKDSSLVMVSYNNVGLIYRKLNNFEKAFEYLSKCESISRKNKDLHTLVSVLNNLGILRRNEQKFEEALIYYAEGFALAQEIDDKKLQGDLLANMSNVYFEQGKPEKGLIYFNRSLEWIKEKGSYYELSVSYINFAYNMLDFKRLQEGEVIADTAVKYSRLCKNYEFIMESYFILSKIQSKRGKYAEAYANLDTTLLYKDSMDLSNLSNEVSNLQVDFDRQKTAIADSLEKVQLTKEFEVDQKLSEEKLWFRDLLLIISFFVLVLVAIGAFLLFKSNRKVRAKNKIVEEQHKEITDSINYAQRIQSAMISNDEAWKQISPHRSIFFQPKDVVSGDFYWAHFNVEKNLAIWSVADCTGHGVPGAFMSVLGSSFLTDIIVDDGETDPAKILDLLRKKVITSLTKKGEDQPKDGMDLGLCVWEKDTNTLHFAGANNPLYVLRRKENAAEHEFKRFIDIPEANHVLLEVPPNKMPIGSYSGNEAPFKSTSLQLFLGDTLILSTDGYADQFGGELGKKLKSRPFKEFLLGIQNESMSEQSVSLEGYFEEWKGSHDQLDDVCVVGIRIS